MSHDVLCPALQERSVLDAVFDTAAAAPHTTWAPGDAHPATPRHLWWGWVGCEHAYSDVPGTWVSHAKHT